MPRSPRKRSRADGRRKRRSLAEPFTYTPAPIDPYVMSLVDVNNQLTAQIHLLQAHIRQQAGMEARAAAVAATAAQAAVPAAAAAVATATVPAAVAAATAVPTATIPAAAAAQAATEVPAVAAVEQTPVVSVPDSTLLDKDDLQLVENILGMPTAVQERMISTIELYTTKCKDKIKNESKEDMMRDYAVRGKNFIMRVGAFDDKNATKEYIQKTYAELAKGFREFEQLDIQVRKDMCRKEMGTSTDDASSNVPFVHISTSSGTTVEKEIAIPQLNYNYTFTCNGKEAPEHMVEWMKLEPHYANDDKKCVIVDKSLFCISGTASGQVFRAGQRLSNEFEVFLVDSTTGWVCIGRKRCESVWDAILKYSTKIAQAVFEALKMAISAALKILNFLASKLLTLVKFSSMLPNGVYKGLDAIKSATKHLFSLQFKAFLMLIAAGAGGAGIGLLIGRLNIPALATQLGLNPFFEAASLAKTSAVLLKHKDALPVMYLANTAQVMSTAIAEHNTLAVNAMLGTGLAAISQLSTSVPFFEYAANVLNIPPKFTDAQNQELEDALKKISNITIPFSSPSKPPPLPSPPSQPPSPPSPNFRDLADSVFRDASREEPVSPSAPPNMFESITEYYEWVKNALGGKTDTIMGIFNVARFSYSLFKLYSGDWTALFPLIGFIPNMQGLSTPVYKVIETISNNPAVQAAVKTSTAARAVKELGGNLGPYWQLAEGARRVMLRR